MSRPPLPDYEIFGEERLRTSQQNILRYKNPTSKAIFFSDMDIASQIELDTSWMRFRYKMLSNN